MDKDLNEQQSERIIKLERDLIEARVQCERWKQSYNKRTADFDNLLEMMSSQTRYIKYLEENQRGE